MIKIMSILLLLVCASWQHKDKSDDDSDDGNHDGICYIEAIGAGYPFFVSTYLNSDHIKPYLNRCDNPVCAWCVKVNRPGEWIAVSATRKV